MFKPEFEGYFTDWIANPGTQRWRQNASSTSIGLDIHQG